MRHWYAPWPSRMSLPVQQCSMKFLHLIKIGINKGRADQELDLSIGLIISTVKLIE